MSLDDAKRRQLAKIRQRKTPSAAAFVQAIRSGDVSMLSKAITLVESNKPEHHQLAQEIVNLCLPFSGNSTRIGITGVPGVGKSTFIESFGTYVIDQGHQLAVLAIDPSSEVTKGSILGDKTRMQELSTNPKAFIRPSPSTGSLGGVANATRESIILCEAAGFDVILVETVGVGQSETLVNSMVDFFLLLMLAGAGDELQGIKRGIMEMADAIAINKADGENIKKAKMARREYANAIHLFPPTQSDWIPTVLTCSAMKKEGLNEIWKTMESFVRHTKHNGWFTHQRNNQALRWMHDTLGTFLKDSLYQNAELKTIIKEKEEAIQAQQLNPYQAAKELFEAYSKTH